VERAEVVVVGAGLIGSAIAWRLAQGGRRVRLLDRGEPGAESSSAAAGLLMPEAGREAKAHLLGLWLASLAQYPDFVAEIRETTGAVFEHRVCGQLVVALDDAQEAALRRRAAAQEAAGIPYEWLSGEEARQREPALTPLVRAALYFGQHGLVDNARLAAAVAQAAQMAGVEVRPYEPVLAIETSGGRVTGVRTPAGHLAADVVVNAAGSWSGQLVPHAAGWVRPARGEIIALQARPRPFQSVISGPGGSVSARADGRIVVGATIADVGFNRLLTAAGVAAMLTAATALVPALGSARFLEAWTGLRPHSPDDQPLLGADHLAGLYWATGHYKTGIMAAPATAEAVADLIEGRAPRFPVDDLSPRRFA
jgi:glycine oxidase